MAESATIARPYARAAFEAAQDSTQTNGGGVNALLATWSEFLAKGAAVVSDGQVASLIGNPRVRPAQLVDFLLEITGLAGSDRARNFLQLLAENRRLDLLPEISVQFDALRADFENTLDVTVTSALPLDPGQSQKLAEALAKRLRRSVKLHEKVDASLIGGAIVQAGDFVVDGSLKGRVERLGSVMSTR